MTEELIKPLLEEIKRKDDRLYMQSNVIAVLNDSSYYVTDDKYSLTKPL